MTLPTTERNRLAAVFGHPGVARAYQHRPPYPPEVFDILGGLITDRPRDVLDVGAGEGALARPLAGRADHVDALDMSAAMVAAGRERPGGRQPGLRWIVGTIQDAPLGGPYALVTAGASMHWMPWAQTLARLAGVMTEHACLAIVEHNPSALPWEEGLTEIVIRHSRNPGFDPTFRLIDALTATGQFDVAGQATTAPAPFRQSVTDCIEALHSTSSLAREGMPAAESADFDRAVADLLQPHTTDGMLTMDIVASLTWGHCRATPI
ncbi:MAG TPA: class I SAM-dependent methyltransferase [Streptosporangiaceae bacterium]|jgi:SAM-dependent methyltransferase|nr:class I SAM-dependent methyltransferase [Streptosporangiaceae bacterium]